MVYEKSPDSPREKRNLAINAARLSLKTVHSYSATVDAIRGAWPGIADHYGEEADTKIDGIVRFACNQLRIEVPDRQS